MNCTLMHKTIEVLELEVNEPTAAIISIGKIYNLEHVPLGAQGMKGGIDESELSDWLNSRSIPASRQGVWDLYKSLGKASTKHLIIKCFGLSLSDHYWMRPEGLNLDWSEINFFQNGFSPDVGEMLFGRGPADKANINLMSPDNTSDGWLKKKWIIVDGKRALAKGGSDPWKQEPFNEVIASAIMRRLGITHVPYRLIFDEGEPLCLCENFLTDKTELVCAWKILNSRPLASGDTEFSHFTRCCKALGIEDFQADLDKMLTLDYIIANEDRHYSNFGLLRDADTLEWRGLAPIFDSGASLWHNKLDPGGPCKCQPFEKSHEEQMRLVSDLSWFEVEALDGIEEEMDSIYSQSPLISGDRRKAIADAVMSRGKKVDMLNARRLEEQWPV